MHRRVLITREASRAAELIAALRAEEITAIAEPVTIIERTAESASMPDLLRINWVAFTSVNAAEIFADMLEESGRILPPNVRLAAVGQATARIVLKRWRAADMVTEGSGGAKLAEALIADRGDAAPLTVLWPCAEEAHPEFAAILRNAGTDVIEWPLYATRFVPPRLLRLRIEHPSSFDVVVFAAPSAVKSFAEAWPPPWTFASVAIGETTAEGLSQLSITNRTASLSPRIPDLVAAIRQALNERRRADLTSSSTDRS